MNCRLVVITKEKEHREAMKSKSSQSNNNVRFRIIPEESLSKDSVELKEDGLGEPEESESSFRSSLTPGTSMSPKLITSGSVIFSSGIT